MKNAAWLITICLVLTSCLTEENSSSSDSVVITKPAPDKNSDHIESEEGEQNQVSDDETPEDFEEPKIDLTDNEDFKEIFTFDHLQGECRNEELEAGLNKDTFGECGDQSHRSISHQDFKDKSLWGLNIEGAIIVDSKISFRNIADREMKVDEQTIFDNKKNQFTKLFDQHRQIVKREANKINKFKSKIAKKEQKLEELKIKYNDTEDEKRREQLSKKMVELKAKIDNEKAIANIAMKKHSRHIAMMVRFYDLAQSESAYKDPKIKNKKSLYVDGRVSLLGDSSQEYFQGNGAFTISVWFRTMVSKQSDKRIINFHHSEKSGSAINLHLRKSSVAVGYRNEKKQYQFVEHRMDYGDNNWHNLIASYDQQKITFFVDGEKVAEKETGFVGFGAHPLIIGSYDGKSRFYTGDIDELSIWSDSFSSEDALKIYNDGFATNLNRHPKFESLSHWFRMGDRINKKRIHIQDMKSKRTLLAQSE